MKPDYGWILVLALFQVSLDVLFYALGVDRWLLAGIGAYFTITLGTPAVRRMWSVAKEHV